MLPDLKTLPLLLLAPSLALAAPPAFFPRQTPASASAGEILPSSIISHDLAWQAPNVCLGPGTRPSAWQRPGQSGRSVVFAFTYPAASSGRRCWLELATTGPPAATVVPAEGAQLDVFRAWAPASCEAGAVANNRDVQLGRLAVPAAAAAGIAVWDAVYQAHLTGPVPCPPPGTVESVEIVPVGEPTEVTFPQGLGAGLRILYA